MSVAVGYEALLAANSDSAGQDVFNTAVGGNAGSVLTSGIQNTLIGGQAGGAGDITGDLNTMVGFQAGYLLTSGTENVAVGAGALDAVVTASGCVAVGRNALGANTSGTPNTAVGYAALAANLTGADATAVGAYALDANLSGGSNTAVGRSSLSANTTGHYNTAVGHDALAVAVDGDMNTAFGFAALANVVSDSAGQDCLNIGIGAYAGNEITSGIQNIAIGSYTLDNGAGGTGDNNVVMGNWSFSNATTGEGNTLIGHGTGYDGVALTEGDRNVCVGRSSHTSAVGSDYQIVMGYNVAGNADNSFCFGNGSTDSAIAFGATSITAPSDVRLKEDIQDEVVGLDFINALRPVTFRWKKGKDVPEDMLAHQADSEERVMNGKYNHGFIAQEVKEVIDQHPDIKDGFDMWTEDEADGRQRIGEGALIPMLTKAVQELSAEIEKLKKEQN
jgi:hypothetical protein